MGKTITGAERPLSKIFSSDFEYHIPQYQRPYAWTEEEAGILFDDLFEFFSTEEEDNYFLGSAVLIKQEDQPLSEVIDGQQRLTTLTILLAVIADALSGDMREDCRGYLIEKGSLIEGLTSKPRLMLREADQPFFEEYVQSLHISELLSLDPAQLATESQQRIWENCKVLRQRVRDAFAGDEAKLAAFAAFLITRCYLVVVSTPNQPSAYRVFSVMNSRGLDLLPTDIIKADIIAKIPAAERDAYAKRWEELEGLAGRDGFEDVFAHTRMAFAKRKAKRALNEEFKQFVIQPLFESSPDDAAAAKRLIDDVIDPMTIAYITVKNSSYESLANADDVNRSLTWLNRINNSDWLPPAMMFLMRHGNDSAYVAWFMSRLERLAAYLLITSKSINKRIARFAEVMEEMDAKPESSRSAVLESVELTPEERQEFVEALDDEVYTKSSAVRRYIILRLDSFVSDGAASYEPSMFTVEHVLPQTVGPKSPWLGTWPDPAERALWTNRIANLVPLNRRRNSAAQNYDFRTKLEKYFKGKDNASSYALTTQVLAEKSWTPKVVRRRQEDLLNVFKRHWQL